MYHLYITKYNVNSRTEKKRILIAVNIYECEGTKLSGLVDRLSHHFWCQHPVWTLVWVLAALHPVQFPLMCLRQHPEYLCLCHPHWGTWLLALTNSRPEYYSYLMSKPVDGRNLFLSLALSLIFSALLSPPSNNTLNK